MRKKIPIIILITLGLFIQCKEPVHKIIKSTKNEQITAENIYDLGGIATLIFYADSTYSFSVKEEDSNYEKIEKFKGLYFVKHDTIYFEPFNFRFNRSNKAVIKNNYVEFVDGDYPLKIEIKKNKIKTKSDLNLSKFEDYAIFTFDPKFYSSTYYNYNPNQIKPYDLNQSELIEVTEILKKCFSDHKDKLRTIDNYIKQCIVVINSKGEKEVWVSCFCKSPFVEHIYKYSIIMMNDGGNCNINMKINLTKKSYSELIIAGEA